MNAQADRTMVKVTALVLEELCFRFAEPSPGPADKQQPEVTVAVGISGASNGLLAIASYGVDVGAIAAELLGLDAVEPDQVTDALGEIANIVCGRVLTELWGAGPQFDLGAPHANPPAPAWPLYAQANVAIDAGVLTVRLYADAQPGLSS